MQPDKLTLRARLRAERDRFAAETGGAILAPEAFVDRVMKGLTVATYAPIGSEADPAMLAAARRAAATVALARCVGGVCLAAQPRVVVGGHGVSASVFMDNAEVRAWLFKTFAARATDMETAAVAQVAYVHGVPFIAFRSLSDLAGADPAGNQAPIFFRLASNNAAAMVRAFVGELDR